MSKISQLLFKHINVGTEKKFSLVQKIIIILIIISCVTVIIESEKDIYLKYKQLFDFLRYFFGIIFILEYLARIIAVSEVEKFKGFNGKIKYIFSFWSLVDLLAIVPLFIAGSNESFLMRVFRLLRLMSFAKFGRFSLAIENVSRALNQRKNELLFSVIISISLLFLSSTGMYLLEAEKQPEAFGSILRSVWWAAAALTTVGYGDVYPITPLGKLFGILSAFFSIGVVALPAGILAGAFTERFNKK